MDILGGRGRLLPVLLVMSAFPPIIFSCEDGCTPFLCHLDYIFLLVCMSTAFWRGGKY